MTSHEYAKAGVDLAGAEVAKQRIGALAGATRTSLSVGQHGGFGGMVRIPTGYRNPVLVMSTDGVGTKVLVAKAAGRWDTVGEDLVNHSVNDILVHAAKPLAFLDYLAGAALPAATIADLVAGVARGCRAHGMALAGGETAQMPGLYRDGDFDLAGTIVGVCEESLLLHGDRIEPGDKLVALASNGLHTNGYTLARRIIFDKMGLGPDSILPTLGATVADALLAVHRSYLRALEPVLNLIHGMAHITGGGIAGNLIRVLPENCQAIIDTTTWALPPLFELLQREGGIATTEMREVFNCGVGMIVAVPGHAVAAVAESAELAGDRTWVIGEVKGGTRSVEFTS